MDLAALTRDIADTHHARLAAALPGLALADADRSLSEPWTELRSLLQRHLELEEETVFPAIRKLAAGEEVDVLGPIASLQMQHIRIQALEATVRRNVDAAGAQKADLVALLDELQAHNDREDDVLFPAALAKARGWPWPVGDHPAAAGCLRAIGWHSRLRGALDYFDAEFSQTDASKTLRAPWGHFARGMRNHMDGEELKVFPAIVALSKGEVPEDGAFAEPLTQMRFELDEIRTVADALRNAAPEAGRHEAALLMILDELEEHARAEEEILFPAAVKLLDAWTEKTESKPFTPEGKGQPLKVLRRPRGRCHECLKDVPAQVVRYDDSVVLEKICAEHGKSTQLLSKAPEYWEDLDNFYFKVNAENYEQRDFIVRMTERCNLDCPICLAKANTEDTPDLDLSGLEKLLSERRGIKVDLMAAEPTLREDLEDWIRKVKATGNIAALHTNGLKLANREYCKKIKDAGVDEVFVQFDGFDDEAHKVLRGRPLLKARLRAMENLRELGIATSLIVVVARGLNEAEVAKTYRFALQAENAHIREVFFLGLRVLGSARDAISRGDSRFSDMAMMPDELIDLLCSQESDITREDIRLFNKVYFTMLSVFGVKKCLYVQHYLVNRDGHGGAQPVRELLNLPAMARASEKYAERMARHPQLARAGFLAALGRHGVNRETTKMLVDLVKLQMLFRDGMNLNDVPRRFLLLGFITACDPHNFDSQVAINCGKGELSVDGGFIDSGAVANVKRESRFEDAENVPGTRKVRVRADRRT